MSSYYLIAYNIASAAGWSYILLNSIAHLSPLHLLLNRAEATYAQVGPSTAIVQTFAALEVFHVLLKWVKSPLHTTAMQVSSRLFIVWAIVDQFHPTRTNPIYASMVLSWAATEAVRYSYYASNLLGYESYPLLYLRYTTFYLLYLTGAPSEAMLIYSTLPKSSPLAMGTWRPTDYFRAAMFALWWPSLYVMYAHMIRQRRKVLGTGIRHSLKSKTKAH